MRGGGLVLGLGVVRAQHDDDDARLLDVCLEFVETPLLRAGLRVFFLESAPDARVRVVAERLRGRARLARVDDLDFDIRFVEHGLQVRGIVAVDALDLARAVVAEREAVAGRDDDVLFVFALVLVPALLGRAASAASVALARLAVRHPVDVRLARGGLGIGGVEAVVDVIPATLVAALAVLRALALDRLALARSESLVTLINVRQRGTSAFVYFC
mmetsp:Transcript_26512/g.81526  ORF Transcript_26512/g.81526 Transcript_26512/m.81526 type:complete len:215 (+) Transcript_26512:782-1426(+)